MTISDPRYINALKMVREAGLDSKGFKDWLYFTGGVEVNDITADGLSRFVAEKLVTEFHILKGFLEMTGHDDQHSQS